MAGALPEAELIELTQTIGFKDGRIVERFKAFQGTSAEAKLSADLLVGSVNFYARK
ncbi:MAG: hypothetical protein MJE77_12570 [Proteobacteria bacterium]|nr:hypothetical protein [Pseudomonadota bacterium]